MKIPNSYVGLLTEEAVELTEGVLDKDEQASARNVVKGKKAVKTKARAKAKAAAKKGKGKGAADSPKVFDKRRLDRFWAGEVIDVNTGKTMIPVCKGCTLTKDENFHCRWKGYYPREERPRICTKTWNFGFNQWASLLHVVRFLWQCHLKEHPEESCPWDFDAIAGPH